MFSPSKYIRSLAPQVFKTIAQRVLPMVIDRYIPSLSNYSNKII